VLPSMSMLSSLRHSTEVAGGGVRVVRPSKARGAEDVRLNKELARKGDGVESDPQRGTGPCMCGLNGLAVLSLSVLDRSPFAVP